MDWPRLILLFLLLPCATPTPCNNCGCSERDGNCKSNIFETLCDDRYQDPSCYVPPGIICNTTIIEICDCDRRQSLIWGESSKKCQVMPGGKCNSTAECVKGSICEGSLCSACPESKVVDPGSGECRFKLNEPCKIHSITDFSEGSHSETRVCPRGTACKNGPSGSICMCHSEDGLSLEYDPKINECRHEKTFQLCKLEGYGFAPKCKIGTKCEKEAGLREEHRQYRCRCDRSMGFKGSPDNQDCFIREDYPCNPTQGYKCIESRQHGKVMECLEDKQSGKFKCTSVDKNKKGAGHMSIGSVLIVGIGLAAIGAL